MLRWIGLFGALVGCKGPASGDSGPVDTDLRDSDTDVPVDTDVEPLPQPIAVCEVEPGTVHPYREDTTFEGSESYDPAEQALIGFEWSMASVPTGSEVTMPHGSAAARSIRPDLAGDYVAQLSVAAMDGRTSDPCEIVVHAIPAEPLWLQLRTQRDDKVWLVLRTPTGDVESDAQWHQTDVLGITPVDGDYVVAIRDDVSYDLEGATDVTIEVYVNGAVQSTLTATISGEGTELDVADIVWSSGSATITPR